ncbi:hypothetical protein B9G99_14370 [Kushneria konosiri]|uniref:Uncharacterized protein n=2 Tax=Kushneria konosiri TaxID=698828 RepID=A0A2Z2H905_9GAMM|nr:hypothetical protein B9G99_14370 [Kushneria konosiri]
MMNKTWMSVAALTLMTGCVSGQYILDEQVSQNREIHPVQGEDGNYLGSFALRKPYTEVTPMQLEQCLSSNMEQRQVKLAASHLRDPIGQSEKVAFNGMSGDDHHVVSGLTGVTHHDGRDLAYRLELQRLPEANYYYFDRLGEAVAGSSDQFTPIGAWASASPIEATQGYEAVANHIQSCLEKAATNTPGENPTGWQPKS